MKKLPPRPNRLLKDHFLKRQGYVGLMARAVVTAWFAMRAAVADFIIRVHPLRLSENSWTNLCTWIKTKKIIHWMSPAEKKVVLRWVQDKVRLRTVANFASDWSDGIVLCALMDALVPGTFPRYDLLNPEESYLNLKRGLRVAETQLGVVGLIKLDDFFGDHDNLVKNLSRFLAMLKLKSELQPKLPSIVTGDINGNKKMLLEEIDTEEALQDTCLVRGMGLQLAVKGRVSRFNIYLKTNSTMDIVIEIKGSDGGYFTERITSRSPRRKNLMNQDLRVRSKTVKGELTSGKLVNMPFEYEVGNNKVSVGYIPLNCGRHKLTIICRGKHVTGSPFTVIVDENIDVPDQVRRPIRRLLPRGASFDDGTGSFSLPPSPTPEVLPTGGGTKLRHSDRFIGGSVGSGNKMPIVKGRKILRVIRRVVVRHGVEILWDGVSPLPRDPYAWSSISLINCDEVNEDLHVVSFDSVVASAGGSNNNNNNDDNNEIPEVDDCEEQPDNEAVFEPDDGRIAITLVTATDDNVRKEVMRQDTLEETFREGENNSAEKVLQSTPIDRTFSADPATRGTALNEEQLPCRFYCPDVDTILETSETASNDLQGLECDGHETSTSFESTEAMRCTEPDIQEAVLVNYASSVIIPNCSAPKEQCDKITLDSVPCQEDTLEDVFFQTCSDQFRRVDLTVADSVSNLIDLNTPRSSFRRSKKTLPDIEKNKPEYNEDQTKQYGQCEETGVLRKQASDEAVTVDPQGEESLSPELNTDAFLAGIVYNSTLSNDVSHSVNMPPKIAINGEMEDDGVAQDAPDGTENLNIDDTVQDIDAEGSQDTYEDGVASNDLEETIGIKHDTTVTVLKRNFEKRSEKMPRAALTSPPPSRTSCYPKKQLKTGYVQDSPVASPRKLPTFLHFHNSPKSDDCDARNVRLSSVREKVNRWESVSKDPPLENPHKSKSIKRLL